MPNNLVMYLIIGIIAIVLCIVFFFIGSAARKNKAEKAIGSAEEEARRILSDAIKNAEAKKKELLIEAKEEEVEQIKALLVEEMKQAAELSVPLEVDVKTGMNWYEAK